MAPEEEIVISFFIGVLGRHIVVVWSEVDLGQKGLEDDVVVGGILGVVVVVEHGTPQSASYPPVVGVFDIANSLRERSAPNNIALNNFLFRYLLQNSGQTYFHCSRAWYRGQWWQQHCG